MATPGRFFLGGQAEDRRLAGNEDLPTLGRFFLVEQAQHRRLAGTRRAYEEDELALLDVGTRVSQCDDVAFVDLCDVFEFDHGEAELGGGAAKRDAPHPHASGKEATSGPFVAGITPARPPVASGGRPR